LAQQAAGKGRDKTLERALRRQAMEPIKTAMAANEPPISHTWLRRKLATHGMTISKTLMSSYLNGWARVPREFVKLACVIAGANPGDVYARIAGHEAVLFQQTKE
jgi:hypothetical protein